MTGVLDAVLPAHARTEVLRYLGNHANEDGGYGLHIEGHSTMFGTALRSAGVGVCVCVWGEGSASGVFVDRLVFVGGGSPSSPARARPPCGAVRAAAIVVMRVRVDTYAHVLRFWRYRRACRSGTAI